MVMNSENAHPGIHVYCLLKWGPFNEILYEKVLQISMVVKKVHFTFFGRVSVLNENIMTLKLWVPYQKLSP